MDSSSSPNSTTSTNDHQDGAWDESLILVFEAVFLAVALFIVVGCFVFRRYRRRKRGRQQSNSSTLEEASARQAVQVTPSMIECALERHQRRLLQHCESFESAQSDLPRYQPPNATDRLPDDTVRRLSQVLVSASLLPKYSQIFCPQQPSAPDGDATHPPLPILPHNVSQDLEPTSTSTEPSPLPSPPQPAMVHDRPEHMPSPPSPGPTCRAR